MAWIFSVGNRIAYRRKIARAAPGSGRPSRIKGDKNDGKYRKYYSWDHDPVCGDDTWSCVRIFYEEGNPSECGKGLLGFASGVMVAASVWSLLIPSMNLSADLGRLAFLPAVTGFFCGILFLLFLDGHVPHLHIGCDEPEGPSCTLKKNTMLVLAVTLHNIPEGMAVGVMFAGLLTANSGITLAGDDRRRSI